MGDGRLLNAGCLLKLSHVGDDVVDVLIGNAILGRHIPEWPVMLPDTKTNRGEERTVGVVTWSIDWVQEGGSIIGSDGSQAVAGGTAAVEGNFSGGDITIAGKQVGSRRSSRVPNEQSEQQHGSAGGPQECPTSGR